MWQSEGKTNCRLDTHLAGDWLADTADQAGIDNIENLLGDLGSDGGGHRLILHTDRAGNDPNAVRAGDFSAERVGVELPVPSPEMTPEAIDNCILKRHVRSPLFDDRIMHTAF